ncbi:hypothetical protein BGZ46_008944 [Entomortierella lignicola]|nr:hypothetical protein BGZ46_008944 [Entomortierella lignicola]
MAEQAPSRLSKSISRSREEEEEVEVLLRDPAPVPRAEDFFNTPAKSFNLNSIPHHKDEFGIAFREREGDEVEETTGEEQNLLSSLPGSLKEYSTESSKKADGPISLPPLFSGSLIDTPSKSNQITTDTIAGKSDVDLNSQSALHSDSTSAAVPESLHSTIQESNEQPSSASVHQESNSLFPSTQGVQGLVLSGPPGSIPHQEPSNEEEVLPPLLALSEVSFFAPSRDVSGLPFSATVAGESTFLENANLQRWDLFDNTESDVHLDDGFDIPREQGLDSLETPHTKHEDNSRISPFAAYIPGDSQKKEAPSDKLNRGSKVTSDRETDRHDDDQTDSDKMDPVHILESLAAAAASSELMKKFLNKDSGDESSSVGNAEQPSQNQPSSQKTLARSNGSPVDNHSSSDDGLTFDEGAGVGVGFMAAPKTNSRHEPTGTDGMDSETSQPRFTTAEKGKQVDRDPVPEAEAQDSLFYDHPLLSRIDNPEFREIGSALLSKLVSSVSKPSITSSPSASSPFVSQREESRADIYPAAPPEPWVSKQLDNKLSQRRPPTATSRTETNDHDPNLAFMSSARKHTPIPPAPTGTKSLLSDFPDTASKPASVAAPHTVTLPSDPSKAPVLKGQYELPSIKKIDQWKKWAVILLLLFNIIEVLFSYTQGSNNFENLPLTPSQRTLLGLDPIISKVPGAVPVFKKSTTTPRNLTEKPILSTYISPSHGSFASTKTSFQKAGAVSSGLEYKDATTILNKSMSRSFNQSSVQDKADLNRLMRNIEAREELQAEWKNSDADPAKRPFGLHGSFGAPQSGLQTGVDMSVPDLLASLNSRGPINRYQPALRTTLSKDHTSKTDLQKDGLYVVGYSKVLKNLKVSEQQLDRWAFNLRKWLWNKVVKHVCSEMEIVDAELARQGLSYLDCKSATMFYASVPLPQNTVNGTSSTTAAAAPATQAPLSSSLAWGAASIANTRLPSAFATSQPQQPQLPTSLQDLETRYGQSRIVKQRIYLESYLAVPGYANRKYVVERLQAMGPLLSHFIWDSHGIAWDGGKKAWSPDLPSDAQIIMHLFTTYIDSAMPSHPSQVYDRFPFTYKHYVPVDNKPDPTTALQIKQTSKYPPDYSLVVEGSMWEVVPKRLNVWYTIVLFIYMVMKENAGYIGQINIGTQIIGLGDVVDGYDM